MINQFVLGLGSNTTNGKALLEKVVSELIPKCREIEVSSIYPTPVYGEKKVDTNDYHNCVAQGITPLSFEEFTAFCKELESKYGRDEQARQQGIVPVDIDVICFNKSIIRHKEISAPYMQLGFQELGINFFTYPFVD